MEYLIHSLIDKSEALQIVNKLKAEKSSWPHSPAACRNGLSSDSEATTYINSNTTSSSAKAWSWPKNVMKGGQRDKIYEQISLTDL